jgi:hypothetical protein
VAHEEGIDEIIIELALDDLADPGHVAAAREQRSSSKVASTCVIAR